MSSSRLLPSIIDLLFVALATCDTCRHRTSHHYWIALRPVSRYAVRCNLAHPSGSHVMVVYCSFCCTSMLFLSLNLSIFLMFYPVKSFSVTFSIEISLSTLCCLTPFVLKYHPLNWGISNYYYYYCWFWQFDWLVSCTSCWSCFVDVFLAVMPVCRVSMLVILMVVVDVLTYGVGGEEHSSSRPISFGWLRVYYYFWCFGGRRCMWCVLFELAAAVVVIWACRTLVVDTLATTVLYSNVLMLDIYCLMYRRRWWGSSRPADVSVTSRSYLFVRKRRSGPTDSYRSLLVLLQSNY